MIFASQLSKNQVNSFLTCKANSRVGTMTSAWGSFDFLKKLSLPSIFSTIEKPKAIVLPDPVCAETNKSNPE